MIDAGQRLQQRMTEPGEELVADLGCLDGDILILGAGGKLGPTLSILAAAAVQKAGTGATVTAVSRFGNPRAVEELEAAGVRAVSVDLADDRALATAPDAPNVVYLVGTKFGTTGNESAAWFTNTYLPGRIADRYRHSRITALSTGSLYPFVPAASGGTNEGVTPKPLGEYAMSCLGRERILEHAALEHGTPMAIIRLNYAVEMRYGVLVDLCRTILSRTPVDRTMSAVNVVWQGYANEVILRSLLHVGVPPFILNVAGPETISVEHMARQLAELLELSVQFAGEPAATSLLSDATLCHRLFGYPAVPVGELMAATARWLKAGGDYLDKPTMFGARDGRF